MNRGSAAAVAEWRAEAGQAGLSEINDSEMQGQMCQGAEIAQTNGQSSRNQYFDENTQFP